MQNNKIMIRRTKTVDLLPGVITLLLFAASVGTSVAATKELTVFDSGRTKIYLDATRVPVGSASLNQALDDFQNYFQEMTGAPLPRKASPLLFDPTTAELIRFEGSVARITDESPQVIENGAVSLALSPTQFFERDVLTGPGEKVVWQVTWHKAAKQLEFHLLVANQPYYGPGYGPFTFHQSKIDGVELDREKGLRLALEMRHQDGADLRGGYSLNGAPWVYTNWFDPTLAGADAREPGKSDKNGAQAWTRDWTKTWANATAFFVTVYGAKERATRVWIKQVEVSQAGKMLFRSDFRNKQASSEEPLADWTRSPLQGKVSLDRDGAVLEPERGSWNTVGLRANLQLDVNNLIPIRLELLQATATKKPPVASEEQGFEISVSPQEIVLRAQTRTGLQNAIYTMLDRWGCRWVMPGKIGEVIPRREKFTLPLGILKSVPNCDTSVEAGDWGGSDLGNWYRRNLTGWEHWLSGQHFWPYAIPPEKYFQDHPNWFALIGGKRVPTQICTSNPEVIAKMIEVAKNYLKSYPQAISFPMDPQDNIDFCQCEQCLAQDPLGRGKDGNPFMTDRVIRFANQVADAIKEEYPDRLVALYAYWTHTEPPVHVKPAKNVALIVTRGNYCLLHLQPTPRCPSSLEFYNLLRRWGKLTSRLYVYEYDPISWTGFLPCPTFLDRTVATKKLFYEYGVQGVVTDRGPGAEQASASFINNYFERRIKADPSRNPDEILTDLCQGFFGPASKPMEAYYRELSHVTDYLHPGRRIVSIGMYRYYEMFNPKMVVTARKYLDQALTLVSASSPYQERVQWVDMAQRYLEAYLDGIWKAQAGNYAASVAAFDRVDALIDEMNRVHAINGADAHYRLTTARLKALAQYFPDRMGLIRDWKLLGPFNNDQRDADRRTDTFEPLSSIEAPVRLPDGSVARWAAYQSPEGLLNLEQAFKSKRVPGKLYYAYAGVKVVAPKVVHVQLRMDSFFPFRVFVNGQEVFYRAGLDSDCPDKQMAQADLHAGDNTIIFKTSQTSLTSDAFPWGIYFRMMDAYGNPAIPSRNASGALVLNPDQLASPVTTFPSQWLFSKDMENRGVTAGWQQPEFDDSRWQSIPVSGPWDNTIGNYVGYAWYRVRFQIPENVKGQRMMLRFEGVDEEAWVYLNGKLLGERSVASTGQPAGVIWDQPFTIPVQNAIFGGENLLAVRVYNSAYAGGIFRPVSLLLAR